MSDKMLQTSVEFSQVNLKKYLRPMRTLPWSRSPLAWFADGSRKLSKDIPICRNRGYRGGRGPNVIVLDCIISLSADVCRAAGFHLEAVGRQRQAVASKRTKQMREIPAGRMREAERDVVSCRALSRMLGERRPIERFGTVQDLAICQCSASAPFHSQVKACLGIVGAVLPVLKDEVWNIADTAGAVT